MKKQNEYTAETTKINNPSCDVQTIKSQTIDDSITKIIPKSRPTIDEILHKQKLTIDDLFKCANDGLKAEKVVRDKYGDEVCREPDHIIRHKFFESLANMLQYLKPSSVNVQVLQVSEKEKELLNAYKRVSDSKV